MVRIVDENGVVVGRSADAPSWIGRDVSELEQVKRHIAAGEISETDEEQRCWTFLADSSKEAYEVLKRWEQP